MKAERTCSSHLNQFDSYSEYFRSASVQHADHICLETEDFVGTYADVDQLSEVLAQVLGGSVRNKPVAIMMPKCAEFYISQLAVMKAGAFFVPLDPAYPQERIDHMIKDSGTETILMLPQQPKQHSVRGIEVDLAKLKKYHSAKSTRGIKSDDFAYMIYTSGSTGKPKGVPIHHKALLNHNQWFIDEFKVNADDRILQFASVSFDISIEEIFPTYLAGARLLCASPEITTSISNFFQWVEKKQITILNIPTAFWHELTYFMEQFSMPKSVRLLIIGGEKVSADRVSHWFKQVDHDLPLYNAYGPTETTITSSVARLGPDKPITIGRAISGLSYHVCDNDNRPVAEGESGELIISGEGVALGYWQRPELTEEKFIQLNGKPAYRTGDKVKANADGLIEFLGRIDDQVKINGFRIEPGEISERMMLFPGIAQAITIPQTQAGKTVLTSYYVTSDSVSETTLYQFLKDHLPTYMVPGKLIELDKMPISSGGKVDVKALPVPTLGKSQHHSTGRKSATEEALVKLWAEIFAIDPSQISTNDDFFELGGDSLKAFRLVSMIEQGFDGCRIPIAKLVKCSSLGQLARAISEVEAQPNEPFDEDQPVVTSSNEKANNTPIVALHGAGGGGLFFAEFESALKDQHPFHIIESGLLYSTKSLESQDKPFEEVADSYLTIIEKILRKGGHTSVILTGYSFGGLLAFELAKRLSAKGYQIEKLINIDAPNPQSVKMVSRGEKICRLLKCLPDTKHFIEIIKKAIANRLNEASFKYNSNKQNSLELRSHEIYMLYSEIENEYVPSFYNGEMVLLTAQSEELSYQIPKDYGWGKLVAPKQLERIEVPGNHLSMITPKHLPSLTKAFSKVIAQGD